MRKIGIFCHPYIPAAGALADQIERVLRTRGEATWTTTPWDEAVIASNIDGTDLVICIGGDGTVLSAARSVIPQPLPILTVKMGNLGFLSEISPDDALSRLSDALDGRYRVERRMMLTAEFEAGTTGPALAMHGLNDVVVSRATVGRPVFLLLVVNGVRLARVRADALIVATPTGSTAYNLSAGGPILHPEASDIVVTAVASHLSLAYPLVLPGDSELAIQIQSELEAIVSVDGQLNRPLASGSMVKIRRSPYATHLVRFDDADAFYRRLSTYLDMIRSR